MWGGASWTLGMQSPHGCCRGYQRPRRTRCPVGRPDRGRLAAVQPLGPEFETGIAFLPDGHTMHIAASNGQTFRWDTEPAAWLTYACQVAGRNLDEEEWRSVFGSEPYRETCPQWGSG